MSPDRTAGPMRLVFVLSLPRSGSTFLARMLVTHPAVTSASHAEPHLFVSAFAPLSDLAARAEWGAGITTRSALDYLAAAPGGAAAYRATLAGAAADTCLATATDPGADWFIEKTTRNSLIAADLVQALPEARFVVMWRNPLDVMASVYRTWCNDNWTWTANSVELFTGLDGLVALQTADHPNVATLRYEDLVADPQAALARLSDFLDIDPGHWTKHEGDLSGVRFAGPHDPRARDADNQRAHARSVAKWRGSVTTARRRRMARQYLDWIGADRLAAMGYDAEALRAELDAVSTPLIPSLAEETRMRALALRRWASVTAWHARTETRDFGRHALR